MPRGMAVVSEVVAKKLRASLEAVHVEIEDVTTPPDHHATQLLLS